MRAYHRTCYEATLQFFREENIMNITKNYLHSFSSISCAALIGLSLSSNTLAETSLTLRANTVGDTSSIAFQGLERFAELVQQESDGDIRFTLHHSGALGNQVDGMESLRFGTLDVATVETPIDQADPVLGTTSLPYLFRDRDHIDQVIDAGFVEWADKRLADQGLRVLGVLESGFRHITNNVRPIVTPSDLEGLTMRTPGSRLRVRTFEEYGADASPLPFGELYTALQTGVFDGQENPIIWVDSENFYEVQDYLSLTGHVYTMTYILMSDETYQKLNESQQGLLTEAARQAYEYSVELGTAADNDLIETLEGYGMEVNQADVASFVKASEPIWDAWIEGDLSGADQDAARELINLITEQ